MMKQKFSKKFLNWRKAIALAKKYGLVEFDEKKELVKVSGQKILLKDVSIELDEESLKQYYESYNIPEWFKPYTKMRHYRALQTTGRWTFLNKRLNDTAKSSATKKWVETFGKPTTWKAYYSMNRMLDSNKESTGQGRPIPLTLCVLDVDGTHKGTHLLSATGRCEKCAGSALGKIVCLGTRLSLLRQTINTLTIKVIKVLYSGQKGYHVYFNINDEAEVPTKEFCEIIKFINQHGKIVDEFINKNNWDAHRVMKMPGSVDATTGIIIGEEGKQITFNDKIAI